MIDKKTSYLNLPLPDAGNALAEDCPRLAEALTSLDSHAQTADDRLDGVEASVTTLQQNIHAIDASAEQDIDALQSVQAAHTSELSDIKTSMAALGADSVHKTGDETISGTKTFTEKLFLTPKEDDRWAETYIYGTENTAKLKIQNKNIDAVTDPLGYPPRSSLTLETIGNAGQGRFTLRAQSKYDTINKRYYQYDLVGTSDGFLTWTGGNYSSLGHIEIVDSLDTSSPWGEVKYIRYSSGLQICWGVLSLSGPLTATNKRITFPVAFSAVPAILTTYNANIGLHPIGIGWESATAFSIGTMDNFNSTGKTSWIAIGPWK